MKICLLGDTHLGVRGDSLQFLNNCERFFAELLFPYLEKNNIDTVFQLGDLFDRRKYINYNTLSRSKEFLFGPLAERGISFHVLVGNHDAYFKNHIDVNSPRLLLTEYNNIVTYQVPTEVVFGSSKFLVLPWMADDNYNACMEAIQKSRAKYVLAHLELTGFEMDRGHICANGMPSVPFDKFDAVYTGHFHTKSSKGNITYVGTPYEFTWADYNSPKGFHILDTETGDLTYVENPFIMHHKFVYNDETDDAFELVERAKAINCLDGYVRIVVRSLQNQIVLDNVIAAFEKNGAFKVETIDDRLGLGLDEDNNETAESVEDTLAILEQSVPHGATFDHGVTSEDIVAFIRDLYVDAEKVMI